MKKGPPRRSFSLCSDGRSFHAQTAVHGLFHGLEDVLVAGAAAQVTGHVMDDLITGGMGIFAQQSGSGNDEAGSAVAALQGSVVNKGLLEYAKEGCEVYNSAYMTLEEVIEVMIKSEKEDKMTVRLHTGDPCLYGAIREQMDILDEKGIDYDSCPGVSSFCGAAAALNLEYTLPEVSQSVIITRTEGRTPVPEREKIMSFAAHGATMVLFLSTGLLEKLVKELLAGGYASDTPAAIVYKATWPEEEAYVCTIDTLVETARKHQITKTALILVGNVVTHSHYERSKLYDPGFTTEFRKGSDS